MPTYKDINLLTKKSSMSGTEKLPVSDTEYITPNQFPGTSKLLSFSGSGSSYAKSTTDNSVRAIAGHIYRFTPTVKEWAHTQTTATDTNALVIGYRIGSTDTVLYTLSSGTWQFEDFYDVLIPSGVSDAYLFVGGRADSGVAVTFYVDDVSERFELNDEIIYIASSITGSFATTGGQNYVIPCDIKAGKEYVFVRTFDTPYPKLAGANPTSSGLRVWTTNASSPSDTSDVKDTIERIYHNSAAIFKRYIKFTATTDASYIHIYVNPNSSGYSYVFSCGQYAADAIDNTLGDIETLLAAI